MSSAAIVVYIAVLTGAEMFRLQMRGRFETAPTALAVGFALAVGVSTPQGPITLSAWQVAGMVVAAQVCALPSLWFSRGRRLRRELLIDCALRALTVTAIAVIVREVPLLQGQTVAQATIDWPGWRRAVLLISAIGFVISLDTPVRVWIHHHLRGRDSGAAPTEDTRISLGLTVVLVACGAILALAQEAIGLVALPLALALLVVTQVAILHQARVQRTHRQIVRALSNLPEIAGLVPTGHATSVSRLSVTIAQEMAMSTAEVTTLESAALLHDLGQVALRHPIPSGATVLAAPSDQEHLARQGAGIVVHVGRLNDVAETIAHQARPYYHLVQRRSPIPRTARVLKVANAYVDYVGGSLDRVDAKTHEAAMERILLGLGYEYDPKVVAAIEKVLDRSGVGAPEEITPQRAEDTSTDGSAVSVGAPKIDGNGRGSSWPRPASSTGRQASRLDPQGHAAKGVSAGVEHQHSDSSTWQK